MTFDLISHIERQRRWSLSAFGEGDFCPSIIDHIREELAEIEAAPNHLEEWIDVVILALDGAWRAGYSPEAIVAALSAKQTKNESRRWPDPSTADRTKAFRHIDV